MPFVLFLVGCMLPQLQSAECPDASTVNVAFGSRIGQPRYDARADVNSDGIVNIQDLALVSRGCGARPASTRFVGLAGMPTISIQPSTLTVSPGQPFVLSVAIANIADLFAFQFDIGFDPTILSAVSVTEGSFLPGGGSTFFIPGAIDNVAGAITFNADTLLGAAPGVTGGGALLTITFTSLTTGASAVTLSNITLLDSTLSNITAASADGAVNVSASGPSDVYQLRYLTNLDKGDSVVNLTNAGTLNGFDPAGRICANVYTFDPAEELISCCACPVTPNGLNSLSARNDLISNTLTPGVPTSITVKLLATVSGPGGTCNPSSPNAANLVRGMRAWATTLHLNTSKLPAPGAYQHTETPFSQVELSDTELSKLTGFCSFIQANGSGFGICKSCRSGGLDAAHQ